MRREGERDGSGGRTEGLAQSAAISMGFADPDLRRRSDRRPRLSYAPGGGRGRRGARERERKRERGTGRRERGRESKRARERETQRDRVTGREGRKELEFLDFQGIPDERRSFGRTACDKDRARERHRNRKSDGGKGRGPNPVYSRTTSS